MPAADDESRAVPEWYRTAKLGIFVHWGLYSVPGFADDPAGTYAGYLGDLMAMRDTSGRNPYAEWYFNSLRIPGSPTARHHAERYGAGSSYFDFQREFERNADSVDFTDWADAFAGFGAEYVVLVTRHLDGYPLWPTDVPNPRMPATYRSRRDLVGDLAAAVRARGLRMGLYYAGGTDWTFTDRPVRVMTDLMDQQSLGPEYALYAAAQWRELIERYSPSILWNDMGWPSENDTRQLFSDYYRAVPDGVVNDRWTQLKLPKSRLLRRLYLGFLGASLRFMAKTGRAIPIQAPANHFDIRTYEYEVPTTATGTWEVTRGLGNSFGYSAGEDATNTLTGDELVHLLVDVVARGGHLLINIGPDGHGHIPEVQLRPLQVMGGWLARHGDAVFGTEPWTTVEAETTAGDPVRFTRKGSKVHAIVLAPDLQGSIRIPGVAIPSGASAYHLGEIVPWRSDASGIEIDLPGSPPAPAQVITFDNPQA
ncbi:alpha-L-fucosidase [Streptomyces sp. SID13031]|uniref:alpha-L-fucosidase n=1 Tax=Streptomyces sp. SID13031 TaxID=2706046 RepID=UPI0013C807A6|nr:alpha-L-fucosidase [Streptomyces sp. SID13031]NEA30231.1 alpha-L-fucosidase [Streptomyces sp. SID13031]